MKTLKDKADFILHECGLLDELKKYGVPHIIGSYKMDMMAWNDLDIDIENENMSIDKLYELSEFILKKFKPVWYEAKEEVSDEGEVVWFHGFETKICGELWNVDLWFFDKPTIERAELFCEEVMSKAKQTPDSKRIIAEIKQKLISNGLYSFDKYTSMDVYKAVLDLGIENTEDFLKHFNTHLHQM